MKKVTEILIYENVATNLDLDPEQLSIQLRFSNMKCSAFEDLSFKPSFNKIDEELTEIQVVEEMVT